LLVKSTAKIIKELQLLDSDISSLTIRDVGTSGPDWGTLSAREQLAHIWHGTAVRETKGQARLHPAATRL